MSSWNRKRFVSIVLVGLTMGMLLFPISMNLPVLLGNGEVIAAEENQESVEGQESVEPQCPIL